METIAQFESKELTVVKRHESGRATVRLCIVSSKNNTAVNKAVLDEVMENAKRFTVIPVGTSPHVEEFMGRAGFSPAFITKLYRVSDSEIEADIDLIEPLAYEVIDLGGWRGFSVELIKDLKTQAMELSGWVLVGGVFTNRPAIQDASFKLAAEASRAEWANTGSLTAIQTTPSQGKGDKQMSGNAAPDDGVKTVTLEFHQKELSERTDRITALEGQVTSLTDNVKQLTSRLETAEENASKLNQQLVEANSKQLEATGKATRLEAALETAKGENRKLEAAANEARLKLEAQEEKKLDADVRAVITKAIESKKIKPAFFEGHDADGDNSAAAWMKARYVSFDAFKQAIELQIDHRMEGGDATGTKTGHTPGKDAVQDAIVAEGEETFQLSDEQRKHLESIGVTVSGDLPLDENTARLRHEKAQQG